VPWLEYNGNLAGQRYTSLDQIRPDNFAKLKVAWSWSTAPFGPAPEFRNISSPLMVDGTLFVTVGATRDVAAIDARTGQMLWLWRSREGERFEQAPRKNSGRGLAYWRGDKGARILTLTPGYYLVALNAATGEPDPEFGAAGWVDLRIGMRLGEGRTDMDVGASSPPLVMNDVIVVGTAQAVSARPPSRSNVKGDVRGFDVRTGKLLWTFHTIPTAAMDFPHHSDGRGTGLRNLARPLRGLHRQCQRVGADVGRSTTRPGLPAGRIRHGRSLRRRSAGREPLHRQPGRGGRPHRRTPVALPTHSSRHLGLRQSQRADTRGHAQWTKDRRAAD
jgi:hypothetical protein